MVIDMNMVNLPEIKTIKLKELTAAQIESICMRNSPDFALFDEEMKNVARLQCKCWFDAIRREFNL